MNEWILRVCAIGLISTIVLLILPQGKMAKYIRGIFSILIAVFIFSPLLDFSIVDYTTDYQVSSVLPDENYLDYIYKKRIENDKINIEKILLSLGISGAEVDIVYNIKKDGEFSIQNVIINLENAVLNSSSSHKYIYKEVKEHVANYLSVDDEVVLINE